ncbi:hypothetical protein Rhopal_000405-T1 [Rhodotorula paludigena]|uniref:EF-hand domain-containing protein n=1 Tax=Rhodotorula paludigena TaxID=86838 RepID=A0AAV5G4T6_9BASI|nr:hypothetical protein Rhopal_000405-T1 [Rhodotorula paludigena]
MRSRATLAVLAASAATLSRAHGDHAEVDQNPDATYAELHMAQEHHMDSFDIQAFFHLHDLNRDKVLDRNELESIYGVHHEKKRKGTKNLEVHTQQAREIVDAVLERLDQNGDGVLTMREFVAGGVGGLPNFKGVEHLGHHYDAEGEYFLHHEEKYHNTPETQREEDYVHPEDIEHFMAHAAIEEEEDDKTREFTGEDPDIAPADAAKASPDEIAQHIFNELNGLTDEVTTAEEEQFVHDAVADEDAHNPHAEMVRPQKKKDMPPPVYNPQGGQRRQVYARRNDPDGGFSAREPASQRSGGGRGAIDEEEDDGTAAKARDPEERARRERAEFARLQAAKFSRDVREAGERGAWNADDANKAQINFARPKDAVDRLRRNIPYKYKVRTSWFGEF